MERKTKRNNTLLRDPDRLRAALEKYTFVQIARRIGYTPERVRQQAKKLLGISGREVQARWNRLRFKARMRRKARKYPLLREAAEQAARRGLEVDYVTYTKAHQTRLHMRMLRINGRRCSVTELGYEDGAHTLWISRGSEWVLAQTAHGWMVMPAPKGEGPFSLLARGRGSSARRPEWRPWLNAWHLLKPTEGTSGPERPKMARLRLPPQPQAATNVE